MTIDLEEFALECVRQGDFFRISPHYIIAVAKIRSGISDDSVDGRVGPFRLTQAEWDIHRTDHEFALDYLPEDIAQWDKQCVVFALMAHRAAKAFISANDRNPSVRELYLRQWPETRTATLSSELQVALDATAPFVYPAAASLLDEPEMSAPIIHDPDQPVPQTEGRPQFLTKAGSVSLFGEGPNDSGVASAEDLALYDPSDIAISPNLFLPSQPPGTTGTARRLNPDALYIACRWDYSVTPRSYLRTVRVRVVNPINGKTIDAIPVDWGPNASTGRIAELSPGLASALDLASGGFCHVQVPLPFARPMTLASNADPRTVEFLFATNRVPHGVLQISDFTGERADQFTFGSVRVHVPDIHRIGKLELPKKSSWIKLRFHDEPNDPDRHFFLENISVFDQAQFISIAKSDPNHTAIIFIHGFNTSFSEGALRFAQIIWDMQFSGIPILFSWPSRGGVLNYAYDTNSALNARDDFKTLIQLLRTDGKVKNLHLIAHSMGNLIMLDALSQISDLATPKLSEIVMAAPDVDIDLYKKLTKKICAIAEGMTLYASANDKALIIARRIAGKPRAGDILENGPVVVDNVDSIDVSAIGDEMFGLNHDVFASNRSLIDDIGRLLLGRYRPPDKRSPQIRRVPESGSPPRYWLYPG